MHGGAIADLLEEMIRDIPARLKELAAPWQSMSVYTPHTGALDALNGRRSAVRRSAAQATKRGSTNVSR
jgi:hypothetical protein